ncbi:uncharacterized protein N7459_004585 [Penicillium hispanicum]|uniref:uncharacterized protein n=1 Tax=Penicillium hispanicum TaxID=1080232 RepID=UPI002541BCED|nr:uncharacterized protein N7459_004585 [Penicillium hispanicum]KAJ5584785.1 hypothetical protein N7459_004585 [Penicillium hispanicum]
METFNERESEFLVSSAKPRHVSTLHPPTVHCGKPGAVWCDHIAVPWRHNPIIEVDELLVGNVGRQRSAVSYRQAVQLPVPDAGEWHKSARLTWTSKESTSARKYNSILRSIARTNVYSRRLEELEDEVRQLRTSVSGFPLSQSRPSHEISTFNQTLDHGVASLSGSDVSQSVQTALPSDSPVSLHQGSQLSASPLSPTIARSLGHVRLDPPQIDSLFHLFFTKYHPFVPLLRPSLAPNDYFSQSPLLFWVVVYIASRQYTEEPSLITALASPVRSLLWETISNPPHSWHVVQSVSLLCMWPFPTSSLSTDSTPIIINIAQTIAMQLGLHQPESIQDYSRTRRKLSSMEISEVVKTWSVCYIASQSIFTTEGMALASSDWMVDRICDEESLYVVPNSIKHLLLIYRFSARVSNYMSKSLPRTPTWPRSQGSISILGVLEQEYLDLSRSIGEKLTAENEVLLHFAGLQLYVFYLLDSGETLSRKMGLVKAFELAKSLIGRLQQLDAETNFMKHCPASYFRATSLAALFILRLEDSNFSGLLDAEGGKKAFNVALSLIRRTSLEDNDLPGRSSKILAQLWSIQGRSQQSMEAPHLKLKSRLAASLLHDQLWTWRESFGGQTSAAHTSPRDLPVDQSHHGEPPPTTLDDENLMPAFSDAVVGRFSFEEVFDPEMLSLLPFDLDGNVLDPGALPPESGSGPGLLN